MGLIVEPVAITRDRMTGFICDKCGVKHTLEDNPMEVQECFKWGTTGGYGSVWGDGLSWSVILCQSCASDLLMPFAKQCQDDLA